MVLACAVSIASTYGCSAIGLSGLGTSEAYVPVGAPLAVDVFSARGFLGGSEYERYVIKDNFLWRECGSISQAKASASSEELEGDELLGEDPSLKVNQRRVEKLSPEQMTRLKQLAARLLKAKEKTEKRSPLPGGYFSLSDPGLFELGVKLGKADARIVTSVDAVADKNSPELAETYELFASLRGVGPTICNARTFFGIGRKTF